MDILLAVILLLAALIIIFDKCATLLQRAADRRIRRDEAALEPTFAMWWDNGPSDIVARRALDELRMITDGDITGSLEAMNEAAKRIELTRKAAFHLAMMTHYYASEPTKSHKPTRLYERISLSFHQKADMHLDSFRAYLMDSGLNPKEIEQYFARS